MGTTPVFGFPYPDPSDLVANYPALGQQLAEDVEDEIIASGGISLITSQTFTTQSSVSVNNCFTSTYDNYKLLFNFTAQTNVENIWIRLRASGTDNTAANYFYNGPQVDTSSATSVLTGRSAGAIAQGFILMYKNDPGASDVTMYSPALSEKTRYTASAVAFGTTDMALNVVGGLMSVTTSYDGFTIRTPAGTFSGNLRVYGYKNS